MKLKIPLLAILISSFLVISAGTEDRNAAVQRFDLFLKEMKKSFPKADLDFLELRDTRLLKGQNAVVIKVSLYEGISYCLGVLPATGLAPFNASLIHDAGQGKAQVLFTEKSTESILKKGFTVSKSGSYSIRLEMNGDFRSQPVWISWVLGATY